MITLTELGWGNFIIHAITFCTNILVSMYICYNNNNITGSMSLPVSCSKGQFPTGSVLTPLGPVIIKRQGSVYTTMATQEGYNFLSLYPQRLTVANNQQ